MRFFYCCSGFFGPDAIRPFDSEHVENDLKAKKFKTKDLELAIRQALNPSLLTEIEEEEEEEEEEEITTKKGKKKVTIDKKKPITTPNGKLPTTTTTTTKKSVKISEATTTTTAAKRRSRKLAISDEDEKMVDEIAVGDNTDRKRRVSRNLFGQRESF
jgi:hypothetical protein